MLLLGCHILGQYIHQEGEGMAEGKFVRNYCRREQDAEPEEMAVCGNDETGCDGKE